MELHDHAMVLRLWRGAGRYTVRCRCVEMMSYPSSVLWTGRKPSQGEAEGEACVAASTFKFGWGGEIGKEGDCQRPPTVSPLLCLLNM